ncbi:MAG: hypothetical protein ACTHJQ_03470 [Rhizobiaceae bacterium]
MSARRLLLAAAVAVFGLTLAGCVDGGPYYGAYTYSDYYGPYYGPGYYDDMVYGGYYSGYDRGYYRRHHHRYRYPGNYGHRPDYRRSVYRTGAGQNGGNWRQDSRGSRGAVVRGSNGSRVNRTAYTNRGPGNRSIRRNNEQQ